MSQPTSEDEQNSDVADGLRRLIGTRHHDERQRSGDQGEPDLRHPGDEGCDRETNGGADDRGQGGTPHNEVHERRVLTDHARARVEAE